MTDTPMTRREWLLMLLLCCVAILGVSHFHEYLSTRGAPQTVLNSLPASKVRCDDSALTGHCSKWNISVKKWEAGQK